MKKLPIGLSDFKELIEENYYYFDKTNFIDEVIKDGSKVKLFARPRRFGKTLNMSMLKYFFDIREAEENRKLFKNLYIERTENFKEQGQYPVVFLSLKDLKADNWESRVDTSDLSRLLSEEEIWKLMLFSGYLTVKEKIDNKNYILRLPNKEVKELFKDTFIERYFRRGNKLTDLMEALTENRIEDYEETLQDILLKSVSYNDTKKGNEAFYHGFILGMSLYLEGEYIVKSNIESGLGRYDVSIESKNKDKRGYILEFKAIDNVDKLEEISKEALKQVEKGKYSSTLKQTDTKEILYLGIAFCGKQIKVSYK